MPYPGRPVLEILPQFVGTNSTRQTPEQRLGLLAFVVAEYRKGRSLRELAELTGRTQTAVRGALDEAGVPRRPRGAYPVQPEASADRPAPTGITSRSDGVRSGEQRRAQGAR